jgi:hypothetical protein
MRAYNLLKYAVVSKKQVSANYNGYDRQFCPHALGWKNGQEHCLAYQFAGQSSQGPLLLGSPDNWRCFAVERLCQISIHAGEWYSCATQGGSNWCLDTTDVEVKA